MRRSWWKAQRAFVAVLMGVALASAPAWVAAQSPSGSEQVGSGNQPASPSPAPAETSKPAPSAPKSTPSAGEVGSRLHDSAKGFGEAILGGIKYAGRKVTNFFGGGDKSEN
jgi:hypothetical protein